MKTTAILILVIILQFCFPDILSAQTFQWVKQEGASGTREQARKTIFDQSGNMYVIGTFGGLNGGSTIIGNVSLTSFGAVDVFIAKFDNNRNLVWIKQGGSIYYDYIYGLESDTQGNIYVSGIFSKSIGSFSAPMFFGSTVLQPYGKADIFIVKFNNDGDLIWANSFGGNEDDQLNGMTKDASGNFYITGGFKNDIAFGNINLTNANGSFQNFITKFNTGGNFLWAKNSTGETNCIGVDIAADANGNTVTTGFFSGIINFENITLSSNGENDIILVKYNSSGDLLWAKSFGESEFDYGLKVEIDNIGNIFLAGSFENVLIFGNNVFAESRGGADAYVCKFDTNGNADWARNSGGPTIEGFTSDETPSDIITDSRGDCYMTGYFAGRIIFDSDTLYINGGNSDVYLVKYDRGGNIKFVKQIKSTTAASYVFSSTLSKNVSDEIFISGSFVGNAEFDNINIQSNGSFDDLYITKVSSVTSVANNVISIHDGFKLFQNYPNPFNPTTIINYELRVSNYVSLTVYNDVGKLVATLVNEMQNAGSYSYQFSTESNQLSSGIYFYRLQTGVSTETKSMILLK